MNKLTTAKRAAVVAALVEGNSIRATSRMTDVSKPTILKLLADLGVACAEYHHRTVRNLRTERVQCDEIWSFVGAKKRNVSKEKLGVWGDLWTWTALDPDSKLIVSYAVGGRTSEMAYDFMADLASRLTRRVQLTTDGLRKYLMAVDYAFGTDVDYAMVDKSYYVGPGQRSAAARYSPASVTGVTKISVTGNPDPKHMSTSHVERQNLTMRMSMRRFTRLTNGFSKSMENHAHAVELHFLHYNFARVHQSLRMTPAMAAGISDHIWSIEELVGLLDQQEAKTAA
jgi:IS1 family transposase